MAVHVSPLSCLYYDLYGWKEGCHSECSEDVTAVIQKVTDAAVVPAAIPKAESVPAAFAVTNAAAVVVIGILL